MLKPKNLCRLGALSLLLLAAPHAHAMPNPDLQGAITMISATIQFITTGLNVLMWILLKLLEILLQPTFFLDLQRAGDGEFQTMLRRIWQFSRDIVNVAMAFVLIGGAIMTVVTANYENIKKHAPTFVLTLILVNFGLIVPASGVCS
ncbi:MAG: hypothetical protein AAB728_05470, partial [Patescibacteria group bacterium]